MTREVERGVKTFVESFASSRAQSARFQSTCARPIRGNLSGHDRIGNAIESYQKGDQEEALGWILAGQCHDRLARETLVKHAPRVLEYMLRQYGNNVPAA